MIKSKSFVWGMVVVPVAVLSLSLAVASSVSVPHTAVAGTPARASEVNQNFEAVSQAINDNHSRLTAMEAGAVDGTIKAAVVIRANAGNPEVVRSFNKLGAPVTVTTPFKGQYVIDFGFDLKDRFWVVTLGHHHNLSSNSGLVDSAIRFDDDTKLWVRTRQWTQGNGVSPVYSTMDYEDNQDFHVLIY